MKATIPQLPASRSFRMVHGLLIVVIAILMSCPTLAQEEPKEESPVVPSEPLQPQPISATEVPGQAELAAAQLREMKQRIMSPSQVDETTEKLNEAIVRLKELYAAPELAEIDIQSARVLDNLNQAWLAEKNQLSQWQNLILIRAQMLSSERTILSDLKQPWQLTFDEHKKEGADDLPDVIVQRVRSTLSDIEALDKEVRERLNFVLTTQNGLSKQNVIIDEVLTRVKAVRSTMEVRILATDSPAMWRIFEASDIQSQNDVADQVQASWRRTLSLLAGYLREHDEHAIGQLLLFLILVAMLTATKHRRKPEAVSHHGTAAQIDVLSFPMASSLLLTLAMTNWIYPDQPLVLTDLNKLAFALPIFLLLRRVIHHEMRVPFYLVLVLYILDMSGNLAFHRPIPARLLLFSESILSLAVLVWVLRKDGFLRTGVAGRWWKAIVAAMRFAALALIVAIVVNIIGAVSLARLLSTAVLTSAYFGLGLYALNLVLKGLLETFLASRLARSANGLRRHPEIIRGRIIWWVNFFAVVFWRGVTFRSLCILEQISGALISMVTTTSAIGTLQISLGDILSFFVALWIGVLIARFARFVLDEDVYPRVRLPRGIPSTITMMVRYTILTLAFLIGLAAAGIELGKFSILAGAVGIGVGFGMQNIINNFVSGLILAFERPIQPGDTVEIGTLFGRVKKIGIRASIIRTYTGAEVIVPNGNLISNEVINWTLSDPHRRLELPIGVAYGTNPHKVIEVLKKVANAHPSIMEAPEPDVYFLGFGDSSLDFELRGWIASFEETVVVKTDLNLGINDALAEAGIEIPFPQRDLHIRSVDSSIGAPILSKPDGEPKHSPTSPAAGITPKKKERKKSGPKEIGEGEAEFGGDADGDGDGGDGY
jgi:potassium efflux system protein